MSTPPQPKLGTTWPSLRKAFIRNGLGMLARNAEAEASEAAAAPHQHSEQYQWFTLHSQATPFFGYLDEGPSLVWLLLRLLLRPACAAEADGHRRGSR